MKIHKHTDPDFKPVIEALVNRSDIDLRDNDKAVCEIIGEVRRNGDEALLNYTNKFDQTDFRLEELTVSPEEIKTSYDHLSGLSARSKARWAFTRVGFIYIVFIYFVFQCIH